MKFGCGREGEYILIVIGISGSTKSIVILKPNFYAYIL